MRTAKQISDAEYDEISFVDVPAAAEARIAIAKRHQEDTVPDQQPEAVYDNAGNEVDLDTLEAGDVVFDADGGSWEWRAAEAEEPELAAETDDQLVGAGVSKAFTDPLAKSLSETLREEIAKASSAEAREEIYKRALGEASEQASAALEIAKRQEDMRLDREYTDIAKAYNVPARPDVLGPILKRMAQRLPESDCQVIHKLLTGVGETLTQELGMTGNMEPADPYQRLEAMLDTQVSKSGGALSKAAATEAYFDADPREYDAYEATRTR